MAEPETPETVEATVLRATPKQVKARLERADAEEVTIRTDVPEDVRGALEGRRILVAVSTSRGRLRADLVDGLAPVGRTTAPAATEPAPQPEAPVGEEATAPEAPVGEEAPAPKRRRRRKPAEDEADGAEAAAEASQPAAAEAIASAEGLATEDAAASSSPSATSADDEPSDPVGTDADATSAPSPAVTSGPEAADEAKPRRRSRGGRRGRGGSSAPSVDDAPASTDAPVEVAAAAAPTPAPQVDHTTVPDGLREAVEALRAARVTTPA